MCVCSSVGQSNGLLSRGSGVRIPSSTLCGGYGAVGQRARLWFWISWVRVPLPTLFFYKKHQLSSVIVEFTNGLSPSGKAQDFDSCIRWFESNQPSNYYGALAQSVEHLTFNQVVRGSNPRTLIVEQAVLLVLFFPKLYMRMWRNWQTRWFQGPVGIPCRFKSCHPQTTKKP